MTEIDVGPSTLDIGGHRQVKSISAAVELFKDRRAFALTQISHCYASNVSSAPMAQLVSGQGFNPGTLNKDRILKGATMTCPLGMLLGFQERHFLPFIWTFMLLTRGRKTPGAIGVIVPQLQMRGPLSLEGEPE